MTDTLNRLADHARELNDEVVRLTNVLNTEGGPDLTTPTGEDPDKS
jgi:hypothetical protein